MLRLLGSAWMYCSTDWSMTLNEAKADGKYSAFFFLLHLVSFVLFGGVMSREMTKHFFSWGTLNIVRQAVGVLYDANGDHLRLELHAVTLVLLLWCNEHGGGSLFQLFRIFFFSASEAKQGGAGFSLARRALILFVYVCSFLYVVWAPRIVSATCNF